MLYYSQNFEDLYLWRCFEDIDCGFFVDIGAHHPEFESVTKIFYDRGWRGVNVDPSGSAIKLFHLYRPDDLNIHAFASDCDGEEVDFYEIEGTGRSTGHREYRDIAIGDGLSTEIQRIKTITINSFLDDLSPEIVHFLKIDAEGAELSVINGVNFKRYRPKIIVIEAVDPHGNSSRDCLQIDDLLMNSSYHKVLFDGVNNYWCSNESHELDQHFDLPPGCRDGIRPYQIYEAQKRANLAEAQLAQYTASLAALTIKPIFVLVSHPSPGLIQDQEIVARMLTTMGHDVQKMEVPSQFYLHSFAVPLPSEWVGRAIVIMFEHVFEFSSKPLASLFYVNPEWLIAQDFERIDKGLVDIFLAKSRDAQQRLSQQFTGKDVVYTGFASRKPVSNGISPDYGLAIHVRGYSRQKGTDAVLRSYAAYRGKLPHCICTMRTFDPAVPSFGAKVGSSCDLVFRDLDQNAMDRMTSRRGLHLCPSEREGFGHYIFGPMSIGAVVAVTDAPPMNELVDASCGILLPSKHEDRGLYVNAIVDSRDLFDSILAFHNLPDNQKTLMGQLAIERADQLRNQFEQNFSMFINLLLASLSFDAGVSNLAGLD